ncbi:hypothetical protein COCOBI_02-8160 [Coccomyxa sp. Obi]|nr:hypothetical protein COCOBI_02-8160 [Coccomyxa sp. Obi]
MGYRAPVAVGAHPSAAVLADRVIRTLLPEVDRPRGCRQTGGGEGLDRENAACEWCPCSAGNSVIGWGIGTRRVQSDKSCEQRPSLRRS